MTLRSEDRHHLALNGTVGAAVRQRRDDLGLSQTELARRMKRQGFSWYQVTVARTESGDRPLRLDEAVSLSAILGVLIEDLFNAPNKGEVSTYSELLELETYIREVEADLDGALRRSATAALEKRQLEVGLAEAKEAVEAAEIAFREAADRLDAANFGADFHTREVVETEVKLDSLRSEYQRLKGKYASEIMFKNLEPGDLVDITVKNVSDARVVLTSDGAFFELITDKGKSLLRSNKFPSKQEAEDALRRFVSTFMNNCG